MNIPNIPTDNLFKFLSIFGLIILFTSIILPISEYKKVKSELIRYRFESKQLETKIDFLSQDVNTLLQITKSVYPDYNYDSTNYLTDSLSKYSSVNIIVKYLLLIDSSEINKTFINKTLLELNEKNQEAYFSLNELAFKENMANFNMTFLRFIIFTGILGIILGVILIIFGFKQWFDFQVKTDELSK